MQIKLRNVCLKCDSVDFDFHEPIGNHFFNSTVRESSESSLSRLLDYILPIQKIQNWNKQSTIFK